MKSFLRIASMAIFLSAGLTLDASAVGSNNIPGFIQNKGQWPANVLFMARQNNANVWITTEGVVVDDYVINETTQMRDGNVSQPVKWTALSVTPGNSVAQFNYIIGNDSKAWRSTEVYSIVIVETPTSYNTFTMNEDGRVAHNVYNDLGKGATTQDVTPTTSTVYGTYLGANANDRPTGIKYLTAGDVLVVGYTAGITFPGVTGSYSASSAGATDGFLVRMDKKLQKVKAYTLIGGNSDDRIRAIAKDESNKFYITGETTSPNFPVTPGVSGQLYKSQVDGFVAIIDSTLGKLLMGTYLGGNKDDMPKGVGVDINGVIYLCGGTTSTTNFPVTFPVTITRRDWRGRETTEPGGGANLGQTDGFLTSMSQAGSIIQSRYFGREGIEYFTSIAIDASSGVYVTGSTTSSNFETAPTSGFFSSGRLPYDRTYNGGNTDGFVAKFNNELALAKSDDGTYSTYFGGKGEDEVRGVFVDALGRAYVVGVTTSTDLPAVGTLYTTAFGQQDIFLAVLSDDGRELVGCTYYGGTSNDDVLGVEAFVGLTTAAMFGTTSSNDFPTSGAGASSVRQGGSDGFFSVLNLSSTTYSTLIPGGLNEQVRCAALDSKGDLYYAVSTESADLHTHDSAYQAAGNNASMYVAKHAFGTLELQAPRGGESWCLANNTTISWQVSGMQAGEKYYIEISQDGGTTWNLLVKDLTGTNYQWKPTTQTAPPGETYQVRVSTSRGHVTTCSNFAFVLPPAISVQPKPVTACQGAKVVLSVEATGGTLRYKWRKGGQDISPPATNATYEIPALEAANAASYDCIISGKCSPSVTSAAAVVTMAAATSITMQPVYTKTKEDQPFTVSVTATGSNLTYQWQFNGYDIAGATTASYTVTKAAKTDAGAYSCKITGTCGTVTSDAATVVVDDANGVDEDALVDGSMLKIVGPNPASSEIKIAVTLPAMSDVTLRVVDQTGSVVWTSDRKYYTEGTTSITLPVDQLASGVYGVEARVSTGTLRATMRVAR